MKIALVRTASNKLRYGGYNIQETGLAKALLKYGVSTDVYARFSNVNVPTVVAREGEARVEIHPLDGRQIYREIMYYPALKHDLLTGGYDLVQLLDDSQMMLPMLFRSLKRKGVKTILWQGMYRNFPAKPARAMQIVYDWICAGVINRNSDLKIAKTEAAKSYLEGKGYTNIITIPVGLDEVDGVINKDLEAQMISFKEKYPHTLLYIGAVEPRRNPDFLMDVFEGLDRNDVGLVIVGDGVSKKYLQERIADSKRKCQIMYYERVENKELASIYERANLFLLPTNYEIYGMVVMEALQAGVPVVSTPEAGPAYILSEKKLGCCLGLNVESWCEEITKRLAHQPTDAEKKHMLDYVDRKFRWASIAERYYDVLIRLLHGEQIEEVTPPNSPCNYICIAIRSAERRETLKAA